MTRIEAVHGRQVFDSRGRPTVEVDVRLDDGTVGRASVPSGASTGSHEAHERRDGVAGEYEGLGVSLAVGAVNGELAGALIGRHSDDQSDLDALLREVDGTARLTRLGANAILGCSLAVCRASARSQRIPLYRRIAELGGGSPLLPMPMVNIFSGGMHAGHGMDVQDFLVIPSRATTMGEALKIIAEVRNAAAHICRDRGLPTLLADEGGLSPGCRTADEALVLLIDVIQRAGFEPGIDIHIAIDVAAHSLVNDDGDYVFAREGLTRTTAQVIDLVAGWVEAYPVVSVEDALDEEDWAGWAQLTSRLGDRVRLIGDDLFTTNVDRLARGVHERSANGILVKVNQNGTLTRTLEVVQAAREAGFTSIVSARSRETEDDFLADLAVGSGAGMIKVGSLRSSDRLAKYNQLLRIAEDVSLPMAAGPVPLVGGESGMSEPDRLEAARAFICAAGFGDVPASSWASLSGGVSSDLWKVNLGDRVICVKGALETLRVSDVWHAPVSRNAVEYQWFTVAARTCPVNVPQMLAHSEEDGFFAMEYLDPATHPVWKAQLMAGEVRLDVAVQVGDVLGRLHEASSIDPDASWMFATDENFRQLRLDPYFGTAAQRNPTVAPRLHRLAARIASTHLAVVHGDLSPKNILVGPRGPVLLDAECAWFGDPAFDVAFGLNHLVLKTIVHPERTTQLLAAARALVAAYRTHVSWEEPQQLLERTAAILPALLLARIDGSSPVEYITSDPARAAVRRTATRLLAEPVEDVDAVLDRLDGAWAA